MHIFEIIEPTTTDKQYKGKFNPMAPGVITSDPAGRYSKVRQNKKDPHTVLKRSKNSEAKRRDPFWTYIELVKKYKLWENPHFPRFYNVTTIKDKDKEEIKKIEMEKLIEGYSLNKKELEYLIDLYLADSMKQFMDYLARQDYGTWEAMVKIIRNIVNGTFQLDKIKNELLQNAVKKLIELKKEIEDDPSSYEPRVDIHAKNIMVRKTSYGPQIVFTDPFSGG